VPKRLKILREAGFTEDSSLPVIWVERSRRQAFSENVISDHDVAWLNERFAGQDRQRTPALLAKASLRYKPDAAMNWVNR
jgi:hypothetical protein